jgi:hypothetical protein
MSYFKTLFNTKGLPDWFVTVNILDVTLAIAGWPFALFMSMVAFTKHQPTSKPVTGISETFDIIVFFVMISYPILIILLMILNFHIYHKHRTTSIILSVLPIIIAATTGIYYYYPYL